MEQELPPRLQGVPLFRPAIYTVLRKPNYYDKPEGQDPWGKIYGLSKYAITTGLFASLNDSLFFTRTRNALETANCIGYWMVPLLGLSVSFASITYIATNIRGKDDKVNYALGGLACAPVLHAWQKSTTFTMWGVAILTIAALAKKDSMMKGWEFFTPITFEYGNYYKYYDTSLVSEEWPKRPI